MLNMLRIKIYYEKNLLFLAPKIHKSTFLRLKVYFFWPLKSTNLLLFEKSTSTFFCVKGVWSAQVRKSRQAARSLPGSFVVCCKNREVLEHSLRCRDNYYHKCIGTENKNKNCLHLYTIYSSMYCILQGVLIEVSTLSLVNQNFGSKKYS